jgi:ribonuclease HII
MHPQSSLSAFVSASSQIGPLVIGACVLTDQQAAFLREHGIKDSKEMLSAARRTQLAELIQGNLTDNSSS